MTDGATYRLLPPSTDTPPWARSQLDWRVCAPPPSARIARTTDAPWEVPTVGASYPTMIAAVHRPTIADACRRWEIAVDLTPWFTMVSSRPTRWPPEPKRKADEGLDNLPAHLTPPGVPPPWRGHFVWGPTQWASTPPSSIP